MTEDDDPLAKELGHIGALNKSITGRQVQPDIKPLPKGQIGQQYNQAQQASVSVAETVALRDQMQKYIASAQASIDRLVSERDVIEHRINDIASAQQAAKTALAMLLTS